MCNPILPIGPIVFPTLSMSQSQAIPSDSDGIQSPYLHPEALTATPHWPVSQSYLQPFLGPTVCNNQILKDILFVLMLKSKNTMATNNFRWLP